jgi:cytoskeleton protein RodZ
MSDIRSMPAEGEAPNPKDPITAVAEVIASNDPTAPDHAAPAAAANPVAAPPVPLSVGALLRASREKLGLSPGDVANKLRMGLKQVNALENSDYASLPTGTFLRGFVRNYAKAVALNADEVLALLEKTHRGAAAVKASFEVVPSQQNINVPAPGGELATPNGRALAIGVVILLLLAAVWYWWEYVFPHRSEGGRATAPATQSIAVPPPVVTAAQAPAADMPAMPPPGAAPAPAEGVTAGPSAEVAATAAPASTPGSAGQTSATPPAAPPRVSASTRDTGSAPAKTPASPVVPTGNATLGFTFSGESWVEVVDGGGKSVLSRRFKAGDAEEVFGRAPFSVVIGNATSTRMAYNGREFNLEPHTRGAVARLTVK